jgi:hypothetical protein
LLAAVPLTPPGGRFAEQEARTLSLVQESAKGNFRPIFEAFNDQRPFEVVQGNQQRFWAAWRTELGEFQSAEVVGTSIVQGDPAVSVRVRFANGGPILQFIWGPRRLAGFRTMPASQPAALVPESPSSWVFYSYRLPHLIRLTFGENGSVTIAQGAVTMEGKKE